MKREPKSNHREASVARDGTGRWPSKPIELSDLKQVSPPMMRHVGMFLIPSLIEISLLASNGVLDFGTVLCTV